MRDLAYLVILEKPLIFYLGILTLLLFLGVASMPTLRKRRILLIPMSWHPRAAYIAITVAVIHGLLALSAYL